MATSVSISSRTKASPSPRPTVPMQKKPGRRSKVACGVCQSPVIDGKDEALLCEGKCGYWLHRGCASVSPSLYRDLLNSEDPFVCLTCTNMQLKQEINSLRSEICSLSKVRDQVGALTNEVMALRQALVSLQTTPSRQLQHSSKWSNNNGRTYANVTARSTIAKSATTTATTTAPAPIAERKEQRPINRNKSAWPKVKVDGARRIWGTVPTCSTRAITTTISKLVGTELQLQIRRKTRVLANNKTVWWFIVKGSENDLTILEQEWDKVQNQTLWTLLYVTYCEPIPDPRSHAGT